MKIIVYTALGLPSDVSCRGATYFWGDQQAFVVWQKRMFCKTKDKVRLVFEICLGIILGGMISIILSAAVFRLPLSVWYMNVGVVCSILVSLCFAILFTWDSYRKYVFQYTYPCCCQWTARYRLGSIDSRRQIPLHTTKNSEVTALPDCTRHALEHIVANLDPVGALAKVYVHAKDRGYALEFRRKGVGSEFLLFG